MKDRTPESGFAEQAELEFAFLRERAFSCASVSSFKVRYESRKVYIEIALGKQDGEVSISFGRMAENEEFSFTLFLRLVNPELERRLGERLADNPDSVRECLNKLADALRSEGQPIINGDDSIFERMKTVRWWDFRPDALN